MTSSSEPAASGALVNGASVRDPFLSEPVPLEALAATVTATVVVMTHASDASPLNQP